MNIRYENAIKKRTENSHGRTLVVMGNDYLTQYVYNDAKAMKLNVSLLQLSDFDQVCEVIPADSFVLVAVYSNHKSYYEYLISNGFQYNKDFTLMNIGGYCRAINAIDPMLGYARYGEEISGYDLIGRGKRKILILGSSTSDLEVAAQKSWPYYFFDTLSMKNVMIYNGAVAGYCSGQEVLKLVRDITAIQPDLVLSFSGVNDLLNATSIEGHPYIGRYTKRMWQQIISIPGSIPDSLDMRNISRIEWGVKENRSDAEIWINNERKMHALCQEFNIEFIGVLEPLIACGYFVDNELDKLLKEAGIGEQYFLQQRRFVSEIRNKAKEYEWFVDCSSIFSGMSNLYSDYQHYNSNGCKLIGEHIGKLVQNILEKIWGGV